MLIYFSKEQSCKSYIHSTAKCPTLQQGAAAAGITDVSNIYISTLQHKERGNSGMSDCCRGLQIKSL